VERLDEQGNEPSGFIKCLGNFAVAERLEISQEGLWSYLFIYELHNDASTSDERRVTRRLVMMNLKG
jgi:hypothetical protein